MFLRLATPLLIALFLFCALVATTAHAQVTVVQPCDVGCQPAPERPRQEGPGDAVLANPEAGRWLVYTPTGSVFTGVSIWIPPRAVTQPTWLRYTVLTATTAPAPADMTQVGQGFALDAFQESEQLADFTFEEPPTITVPYSDAAITGLDEASLTLTYWDGNAWQDVLEACAAELAASRATSPADDCITCKPAPIQYACDFANNRLTAPLCHLTEFALLGAEAQRLYVPLVLGK